MILVERHAHGRVDAAPNRAFELRVGEDQVDPLREAPDDVVVAVRAEHREIDGGAVSVRVPRKPDACDADGDVDGEHVLRGGALFARLEPDRNVAHFRGHSGRLCHPHVGHHLAPVSRRRGRHSGIPVPVEHLGALARDLHLDAVVFVVGRRLR